MKIIRSIWEFIKKHPYITVFIVVLVWYIVTGYETKNWNPAAYWITVLFVCMIISPFEKKARYRRKRKEEIDYLAKRIAEEQKK